MKESKIQDEDIHGILGTQTSPKGRRRLKWVLLPAVLIALGVAVSLAMREKAMSSAVRYKYAEAVRGDLSITVTATGNLEPTNQVDVGSELSGTVRSVEVRDNDRVETGQVLARLDTAKLTAQNLQHRAALKSAEAKVLQARATVREAASNLSRLKQVRELSGNKIPSQFELDAAEAALERARAEEAGAEASVEQARATLQANETDLSKTEIMSPINGVVLVRNVEPGQTVAASLQAPVLFTLAEDLTQMELHVDVDEADVGLVQAGQRAVFTVDAYPEKTFPAEIQQVRYGSQTVDGVVTYETILNVENEDLLLRPGMTATAEINVKTVHRAVLIPNAALRFSPPVKVESTEDKRSFVSKLMPGPPRRRRSSKPPDNASTPGKKAHVWTHSQGRLKAVPVEAGITDGTMTQVTGGEVAPGMSLIIDTLDAGR